MRQPDVHIPLRDPLALKSTTQIRLIYKEKEDTPQWTSWRNGSASDSRSEGCVFKSRRGHEWFFFSFQLRTITNGVKAINTKFGYVRYVLFFQQYRKASSFFFSYRVYQLATERKRFFLATDRMRRVKPQSDSRGSVDPPSKRTDGCPDPLGCSSLPARYPTLPVSAKPRPPLSSESCPLGN